MLRLCTSLDSQQFCVDFLRICLCCPALSEAICLLNNDGSIWYFRLHYLHYQTCTHFLSPCHCCPDLSQLCYPQYTYYELLWSVIMMIDGILNFPGITAIVLHYSLQDHRVHSFMPCILSRKILTSAFSYYQSSTLFAYWMEKQHLCSATLFPHHGPVLSSC